MLSLSSSSSTFLSSLLFPTSSCSCFSYDDSKMSSDSPKVFLLSCLLSVSSFFSCTLLTSCSAILGVCASAALLLPYTIPKSRNAITAAQMTAEYFSTFISKFPSIHYILTYIIDFRKLNG